MSNRLLAILFSGSCGFISLSLEILWVRLVSFAYTGVPQSFSFTLASFLLGISLGAVIGKRACTNNDLPWEAAAWALAGSAALSIFTVYIASAVVPAIWVIMLYGVLIAACAALLGIVFPIVHHIGSNTVDSRVGRSFSVVYFSNVLGAALGPILTGWFLLDVLSLKQCLLLFSALAALLSAVAFARASRTILAGAPAAIIVMSLVAASGEDRIIDTLQSRVLHEGYRLGEVIENRHGIIHTLRQVDAGNRPDDIVVGGNAYDGRTNVDLRRNTNSINRPYFLASLHDRPRRILVIGMSTGAWARVLLGFPGLEQLDIVEINPGYLELTRTYPQLQDLFLDPRVRIHTEDGRRWLRRHDGLPFDLVVINTTLHWRAYASQLLSQDMLQLIRSQLAPGGLVAWNSTGSLDAISTGSSVFKHVRSYMGMVIGAEHDWVSSRSLSPERIAAVDAGEQYRLDLAAPDDLAAIQQSVFSVPLRTLEELEQREGRPGEIITIRNMLPEFKYGRWRSLSE